MDIVWLDEPRCREVTLVGGKIANLAKIADRFRVPPGFGITAGVFARWTSAGKSADLPPDLCKSFVDAYKLLGEKCGEDSPPVAVRSSAAEEDGTAASFAGLFETCLNIAGADALIQSVQTCWRSATGERVRAYATPGDGMPGVPKMGVFVQQFIRSDLAAVAFSANPVTGSRDEILINANYGLCESVVSGKATPDTVVVRKSDLKILSRDVGAKERMTVPVPAGVRDADVPAEKRRALCIKDEQSLEIARLVRELELFFGWPVDCECAYLGSDLFVLQCRPVTTLS